MKFKNMKLATKLALIIAIILALIFVTMVAVTGIFSGRAIRTTVAGELNAISKSNGNQVQQIFDAAKSVANNMNSYMEESYYAVEKDPQNDAVSSNLDVAVLFKSAIYGVPLSQHDYNSEEFLIASARGTAKNNEDIAGVGVMFEPYKFAEGVKDYAFYIDEDNKDSAVEPYGTYEEYAKKEYYMDASERKDITVTPPYDRGGVLMVSLASPIIHNDEVKGVAMADIDVTHFDKVDSINERYPSMYATIYDDQGRIIYDSEDISNAGKNMQDFMSNPAELEATQTLMKEGEAFTIETTREDGRKVSRFFNPVSAGSETWWSLTALNSSDIEVIVSETVVLLVLISIAALIVMIVAVVVLIKRMLKPMQGVVAAAERISEGNLDVQIDIRSGDEIGMLSRAFLKMSGNLKVLVNDTKYLLEEMADGNFDIKPRAMESYVGDYEGLLVSMRKLNYMLSDALQQINLTADQVSAGAGQVSDGAQALAQGTTEQASSVQQLAAVINEISGQIKANAQSAQQANSMALVTEKELLESNRQMAKMTQAMNEISSSSGEIAKIIKTIEDIAFKTNILALNAAVEAARAGDAGKGFAVVADEVRNLASKSAEASQNTADLIETSLKAVQNGMQIANATAVSLTTAVEGAEEVTAAIDQITRASTEQADAAMQVTMGIEQISTVVQTNSATAEESSAASEELSGQAQVLKNLVGKFKLQKEEHDR